MSLPGGVGLSGWQPTVYTIREKLITLQKEKQKSNMAKDFSMGRNCRVNRKQIIWRIKMQEVEPSWFYFTKVVET